MSTHYQAQDLSIEEQASLTSGGDAWHLQSVESKGIPGYMITDGPHGLRKTAGSSAVVDLDHTVPATCFPPAAGMSSSWNPQLIHEVGEAMAEECIQEKVAVILGPGVNIKRNPLGGRCFEYWSEDPYLAGHEAVGIVTGVQSKGIGTSLKHFAVNNQETDRLRISANVSARALREIYFPAFEYIVTTAQPWTVMCSYNQINGVFSSENHWLLTDVLRGEWGFKGIVMSDWGADHDRVASLNAGLNLEMPPSNTDAQIVDAIGDQRLEVKQLSTMAQGMLDLNDKASVAMAIEDYRFDVQAHNELARRAAVESIVLLKNEESILPLTTDDKLAVIGEFARTPRYQGSGSSHITPTKTTSFLDALQDAGIKAEFAPGFTLEDEAQDQSLSDEAVSIAEGAHTVIVFLGLPPQAESEGFDRTTLDIPRKQVELLAALSAVNSRIVVVLSNGSVVSMEPWSAHAKGIVESWLLGQAGGSALVDVLFGSVSPSGKLAQSIPLNLNDDPSTLNWPGEEGHVDYGEGVFVGYRYYDSFKKQLAYPFGFGMSYADFTITDVHVEKTGANTAVAQATVSNVSAVAGAQTVQVYVAPGKADVARPVHELKGFAKTYLEPGESREVSIPLDERSFAYWSQQLEDWHIEKGTYNVEVGTSSRDIYATQSVTIEGDGKDKPLNEWSNLQEWRSNSIGAKIVENMVNEGKRGRLPMIPEGDTAVSMFIETMPLNTLSMLLGEDGTVLTQYLLDQYGNATA